MDSKINGPWRQGGMSSNNLRYSTQVLNYFRTPGRMNLIPDATPDRKQYPKLVSSIGSYKYNGNKSLSAGTYGPGTLLSSNVSVRSQNIPNEINLGKTRTSANKTQFVDYRSTDPILIQNLRNNPLSIYAVGDAKNAEIPPFYAYVRPENYNTYTSEVDDKLNVDTVIQQIDGSPQVNILDLNKSNPFMGLTNKVNDKPTFNGKVYGGTNGNAKPYALELYNQSYKTNYEQPIKVSNKPIEEFSNHQLGPCKNEALTYFSPGYNISNQINNNRLITWSGRESIGSKNQNLPWDVIWTRGNNKNATVNTPHGYVNNKNLINVKTSAHYKPVKNCYQGNYTERSSLVC